MINTKNLPAQLREQGLFCCWRYELRNGAEKPTKVPYNPATCRKAQSTNPGTFAALDTAMAAVEGFDGIGVGIFGDLGAIDIDHCIDDTGKLSDMAQDIAGTMGAYTERSPSGKGLRILFTVPKGFQYDKSSYYINNQKLGLEVYIAGATSKYVTVTGDALTPGIDLEERGEQLSLVLSKYMGKPRAKNHSLPVERRTASDNLDDWSLIERAKQSQNGMRFTALWNGDTTGYKSHSEADMALCSMLAFWTNKDAARMDRLYRQSNLMREKWDRPQSGSSYGALTIQNAINNTQQGYEPQTCFQSAIVRQTTAEITRLADLHPEKHDRYKWNDIGNGYLFADWYRDKARYVPERKKWFIYDGRVWVPDTGNLRVMELCKELADKLVIYATSISDECQRNNYIGFVRHWQRRNYRETILKDAAGVYPVRLADFDTNPYLFNCLNGTLDLQTREFRPHDPTDMLSIIAKVKYIPEARSALWERVVSEAMQGDAGKVAYLQKAMGYGLTGDTSQECFFIFYGATTRNGKGTLTETYMYMLGDYGRATRPETIAQKSRANSTAPTEDIARLAGARAVNVSEPDKGMLLSSALVKTLTGNDRITARFLNENSFEFYPQFKFFINTNYLPQITDVTMFSSGRVKVIPFERHFEEAEQDKNLKKKLIQDDNLSGILNWCLDGLKLFQEIGFDPPPPAVLEATTQYQKDCDKISRFVEEMMEQDSLSEIHTEEAYQKYQAWCIRNGQRSESLPYFKNSMGLYATVRKKRPQGAGRNESKISLILGMKWQCGPTWSDNS